MEDGRFLLGFRKREFFGLSGRLEAGSRYGWMREATSCSFRFFSRWEWLAFGQMKEEPKLLGKSENALPAKPSREILDRFENCRPGRNYWINLDAPEFSSLCPVTGQPDSAHVVIRYRPGKWCVETKSLKFYLASWRNTASFNEEVINTILDDLVAVCEPAEMEIQRVPLARAGESR